jgi:hypothetical protein
LESCGIVLGLYIYPALSSMAQALGSMPMPCTTNTSILRPKCTVSYCWYVPSMRSTYSTYSIDYTGATKYRIRRPTLRC